MELNNMNQISEHVQLIPRLQKRIKDLEAELFNKELEYTKLKKNYAKESLDVERLEKESFSTFVYKFIGKLDEKYKKEQQEMIKAKLILDEVQYQIEHIANELKDTNTRLNEYKKEKILLDNFICERKQILENKYNGINNDIYRSYLDKNENINKLEREKVELEEAMIAAREAIETANRAINELSSAENIANYDTFLGGGLLADSLKYNKIDEAQLIINELSTKINKFRGELADVNINFTKEIELTSMDRTLDIWFDNIFTDMKVRDKIIKNKEEIQHVVKEIENARRLLVTREAKVQFELEDKRSELEQFIINLDM